MELSKTITQEEEEEEQKAHLSVCSFIKPPASLHDLPVQHEIFISCIFCGEALKRLCCRSSFITAAKQSSSDPLRSQIKHRLYSAFVSCWFLTKQDVTDSRAGVLSPLTPLSPALQVEQFLLFTSQLYLKKTDGLYFQSIWEMEFIIFTFLYIFLY